MPLSRHSVETCRGNELTCNSSGDIRSQSSQFAEPLWTDPGRKSEISVCELISTEKKHRKVQTGNELSNILPKSLHARKKPPPPPLERDFLDPFAATESSNCEVQPSPLTIIQTGCAG